MAIEFMLLLEMDAGSRIKSWREEVMELSCTFAGLWKDRKTATKAKQRERLVIRRSVRKCIYVYMSLMSHSTSGGRNYHYKLLLLLLLLNT